MTLVPFLLASITLPGPKDHPKQPAWLDFTIASYIMRYDDSHEVMAVHDSKSGFYVARTVDCDGAIVTLTLTKDRSEIAGFGFPVSGSEHTDPFLKVIEKALPSLSTGRGVKIGDSPATVKQILGKPTETDQDKYLTYTYEWKTKVHGFDGEYDNVYTFKAGKLIEISFWRSDGVG